ncbi:Sensor histidine kinase regulating citrate/malate metabolism [Streptomyces zhaozhouensis]|uniref:histidine kinase n=1 Tax=Streptomyces zhaozhouensis TaxID=1300267 RepID=A0A286DRS2_9ACTN|nr:sensor histidine kinase [Streptomyces zhaozhouensis]SOD61368.1 Sensor histidine kinase regulating citrate/malate metabolism [Streptomyces zhaozhouensis]
MRGRAPGLPRLTLAGRFLVLQLGLIVVVLVVVAAVSIAQADRDLRRSESGRLLGVAESVASQEAVRVGLTDVARRGILEATAEHARGVSGASSVEIAGLDRRVLTSADPRRVGTGVVPEDSPVFRGRSWTGTTTTEERTSVAAHVPVFAEDGRQLGAVVVASEAPSPSERVTAAVPDLALYVSVASLLGAAGSVLLARRIKRQTLGLEPGEITSLVEHREAMLHGIREGVLGLDGQGRISLANDSARALLRLPADADGRALAELPVEAGLHDVLTGRTSGHDQVVFTGERVLTLNRRPLVTRGQSAGSVTTMRDLTELASLQQQLAATRSVTDTLRAQAHQFSNHLHVIAGLVELGEFPEVTRYVRGVSGAHAERTSEVLTRVADPSLAALLIAKSSLAAEQGAALRVTERSSLGPVPETLSADLVTVTGNLVDNALDAVRGRPDPWVEVEITVGGAADRSEVTLRVTDSGPGVPPDLVDEVFRQGFTTKPAGDAAGRGLGLAITRLVCARRGGGVTVSGAEFTAGLPWDGPAARPGTAGEGERDR